MDRVKRGSHSFSQKEAFTTDYRVLAGPPCCQPPRTPRTAAHSDSSFDVRQSASGRYKLLMFSAVSLIYAAVTLHGAPRTRAVEPALRLY